MDEQNETWRAGYRAAVSDLFAPLPSHVACHFSCLCGRFFRQEPDMPRSDLVGALVNHLVEHGPGNYQIFFSAYIPWRLPDAIP